MVENEGGVATERRYTKVEDFVKVYRECETDEEVAEKLGMSVANVKSSASRYRGKGILLPKRKRKVGKKLDEAVVNALNEGYTLPDNQA